ncbi:peptidyl-prolyl cis-trans isomerase ssp-1 [Myxozyma melibiosi]|uniref:Peptidyl-prolyl cis-trans isomerase n=1 Tax=Myxozyma melibiosi TaxID=54550 RepID=A0ABR1FF74_9ASCO
MATVANTLQTTHPTSSSETGLPPSWEIRLSRSHNIPYYFNPATHESTWEPPLGTDADRLKVYMAEHHSYILPVAALQQHQLAQPSKIRASHLLIKHAGSRRPSSWKEKVITRTEQEAYEILRQHEQRIRSGQATLAELAVAESDCSSARKGGDLGMFGPGEMQKEFEEATFALKVGEMSGIVKTASGLHLIERTA